MSQIRERWDNIVQIVTQATVAEINEMDVSPIKEEIAGVKIAMNHPEDLLTFANLPHLCAEFPNSCVKYRELPV